MPPMSRTAPALLAGLAASFLLNATACQQAADRLSKGDKSATDDKGKRPAYLPDPKATTAGATANNATIEQKFDELVERLRDARQLPPATPKEGVAYAVPVGEHDIVEGDAAAPVTMIEAFEFMCPYCAKVHPTVEALQAKYGKKLRVVSKYLVVHGEQAVPPALWACAAGKQGKYTEYTKALWSTLFDPNLRMQKDKYTDETYKALATQVGMDLAKAQADVGGADMSTSPCVEWIKGSIESLDRFNVSATPGFFINGQFLGGAYPQAAFEKLIDAELAKAETAIKGGVAPGDYYAKEILAKGVGEVVDILAPR